MSNSSDRTPNRFNDNIHEDPLQHLWDVWNDLKAEYNAAGSPFGPSDRGLEVWIEYDVHTTAN